MSLSIQKKYYLSKFNNFCIFIKTKAWILCNVNYQKIFEKSFLYFNLWIIFLVFFFFFFALFWPKIFSYNCWSKKDFWKLKLQKIRVFTQIKMQNFHLFKKKLIFFIFFSFIFKSSFFRFKFYKIVQLLEIFPTVPKLLNFENT